MNKPCLKERGRGNRPPLKQVENKPITSLLAARPALLCPPRQGWNTAIVAAKRLRPLAIYRTQMTHFASVRTFEPPLLWDERAGFSCESSRRLASAKSSHPAAVGALRLPAARVSVLLGGVTPR